MAYVAVDEARRSLVPDGSLKSLDFIVSPPSGPAWLVDVKGRRFPSGDEHQQYWKNWSTRDDLRSLAAWQRHFGDGFLPLLVFAYHLVGAGRRCRPSSCSSFAARTTALSAVRLADFVPHARPLSDRWDTVAMPVGEFRRSARSLDEMLQSPLAAGATTPAMTATDWQPLPAGLE